MLTNRVKAVTGHCTPRISMGTNLSRRIYKLLLIAYPAEFRHEYGAEMAQVFRDRYHYEAQRNRHLAILAYWFRTVVDLVVTATKEHSENFGKDRYLMNNLRRDIVALLGCTGIVLAALVLLRYGISHEVSSILVLGKVLDAVVTTGIIGNLIVFILVKVTKRNSLRIALWTFLIVHVVLVFVLSIIGSRVEPQFSLGSIIIAYVVSFLFWFGLHWAWRSMRPEVVSS